MRYGSAGAVDAEVAARQVLQNQGLGPARCLQAGCQSTLVGQCGYRDARGERCLASLCPEHAGRPFAGQLLCRRHAAVARHLAGVDPLTAHLPRPGDRRFALLLQVQSTAGPAMLAELAKRHPEAGVRVAADAVLKEVRRGDELAWEAGWSAYSEQGNLDRVTLRVGAGEPPVVRLIVNHAELAGGVPYWITRRLSGAAPDARDAEMFNRFLAEQAGRALAAGRPASWLPA